MDGLILSIPRHTNDGWSLQDLRDTNPGTAYGALHQMRATIEVLPFFSNSTPQFEGLRPLLSKTDLEKKKNCHDPG